MGIRQTIIRDQFSMLVSTNNFGLPVALISPDGDQYTHCANDPESVLAGRITFSRYETGDNGDVIAHGLKIILAANTLSRIPLPGENWIVQSQVSPSSDVKSDYTFDRPPRFNPSLGRVTLWCEKVEQS